MMNRGVMDRQMFRNGGAVKMQEGGDPVRKFMQEQANARFPEVEVQRIKALRPSIALFIERFGRNPTREEVAAIEKEQERIMMMQEGVTGPSTMSPDGPGPEGYDLLTPQMLGPMRGETVYAPRPTVQEKAIKGIPFKTFDALSREEQKVIMGLSEEGAGLLGGFAPGPSQELPPPINLEDYFQSPRGDEMDPVIRRQEGGPAMVMPSDMASMAQQMPAAAAAMTPPEQEVVMGAMQASGGPEVQQMIASEAQSYGDPETAESYEEMMNMVRGDQATEEERRSELAMLVGEEDARQTPVSVLALVQPIVQLSMVEEVMAPGDNVDAGVGALAAQEMTTPVQGDMAGGVMTLAGGAEPQMQGMA